MSPELVLNGMLKEQSITAHEHLEALVFSRHAAVLKVANDRPKRDEYILELVEGGYTVQCRPLGLMYYVTGWEK